MLESRAEILMVLLFLISGNEFLDVLSDFMRILNGVIAKAH
jgi:hypothetical protein